MDGVAGAFAVVSLAIQLANTIQQISKFLRNVHDAPKEVVRLVDMLDQLHGTLDHARQLIEQQFIILRLPGSPEFITKALENCEKQVKALERFANQARKGFDDQHKLRRTWASMKMVVKRQDLDDIQGRLRDAKMDLQFAISGNSWQLQY
jgi:integrase